MKHTQKIVLALATVLTLGLSAGYGFAQGKPGNGPKYGMMADAGAAQEYCCMHEGTSCPMHDLLTLAEIKVEKTKTGAAVQFSAKDAAKVAEVQALADKLAGHMKAGDCPMMRNKGDAVHGYHHGKPMAK